MLSLGRCNIFVGDNGSGKTSLLEAIHLLSHGKSFRHHEPKRYISHGQTACTVWASLQDGNTLAICKNKDATTQLRHNQTFVHAQSTLSKILPTLLIDPANMHLFEEGSNSRRQLLDWLCFHRDEGFYGAWLGYQRLLKQRNHLLKHPNAATMTSQIHAWDNQLSTHATSLHHSRQAMFEQWQTQFSLMVDTLLPSHKGALKLSYQAGFDDSRPLKQILRERLASDIELGYTRIGAHRADIGFVLDFYGKKESALHILSRGEKKLLIIALKLSQLGVVCHNNHHSHQNSPVALPLVLIDDITAELDDTALHRLLDKLGHLPCQLFITSLDDKPVNHLRQLNPHDTIHHFRMQGGTITPTTTPKQ